LACAVVCGVMDDVTGGTVVVAIVGSAVVEGDVVVGITVVVGATETVTIVAGTIEAVVKEGTIAGIDAITLVVEFVGGLTVFKVTTGGLEQPLVRRSTTRTMQ
jgi:hypothetical protein